MVSAAAALDQLKGSGYLAYVLLLYQEGTGFRGVMSADALPKLRADSRFATGVFWGLHRDVGSNLTEFRSYNGSLGKGSMQLVIDQTTGAFWCDVDAFNPYQDVVSAVGHLFGEVIPHWAQRGWRRLWRKR